MIVVDASVLVAIVLHEPERGTFAAFIERNQCVLSPAGYWEAATRISKVLGPVGLDDLAAVLSVWQIRIEPATAETARTAAHAQLAYGKHTPAKLNLGDCFAYALAKELDAPLLFKGDDFTHTDIRPA